MINIYYINFDKCSKNVNQIKTSEVGNSRQPDSPQYRLLSHCFYSTILCSCLLSFYFRFSRFNTHNYSSDSVPSSFSWSGSLSFDKFGMDLHCIEYFWANHLLHFLPSFLFPRIYLGPSLNNAKEETFLFEPLS